MPPCREFFPPFSFPLTCCFTIITNIQKVKEETDKEKQKSIDRKRSKGKVVTKEKEKEKNWGQGYFNFANVNCLHWGEYYILILDLSFFLFLLSRSLDPLATSVRLRVRPESVTQGKQRLSGQFSPPKVPQKSPPKDTPQRTPATLSDPQWFVATAPFVWD